MPTSFDFRDKVVLVTGVARVGQIGHAVAEAFGSAGASLIVADRNAVAVAERVREFSAKGWPAKPAAGDLTAPDIAALAVENAIKHFGRLDVLVNVAGGLTTYGPVDRSTPEDFDREMAINVKTALLMSQAALKALIDSRGCIVNFASAAVAAPAPQLVIYTAAKAAVAGLTGALAAEVQPHGVRVNAIAPAMVRTAENVAQAGESARYVEMHDITNAVLFLASDAASAITGRILPVGG
ncbi:MAG: SDR family NAD(P)-dependent oxidoreductase [Gemmatimonadales bacterium]